MGQEALGDGATPIRLQAALAYIKRSWPVSPGHSITASGACSCNDIRCDRKGKHPRTRHGLTDATLDEAQIREWWRQWPDANVLIRTGKVGERYLVVLDVDPRSGGLESLAECIAEHGEFPVTPRCRTGGGGFHLFMWSRFPVGSSAGKVGKGLDVRGEGGYVIGAGSNHASGKEYAWEPDAHPTAVPLAETPPWFVALAGTRSRVKVVDPGPQATFIIGQRNEALFQIGCAMRRPGVGEKAILAALTVINEERCKPKLLDYELEKIARSAGRYTPGAPVEGVDGWEIQFAAKIAAPLPPMEWVVEGLGIAAGGVTLVGGVGFGGKTMAVQDLMLSVASGKKAFGHFPVTAGEVLHVDFEQGPRLTFERYQRQARSKCIDLEELGEALGCVTLPTLTLAPEKASEKRLVDALGGKKLCVLDAFRGAFPDVDENKSTARAALDMLVRVSTQTNCAIVVVAHSNKKREGEDIRNSLRGSGAIFDAAQTVYMFEGVRHGLSRVHNTKDRLVGEDRKPFGLKIRDEFGAHGEARWGLILEYLDGSELEEGLEQESEVTEDERFAMNAARLSTMGGAVLRLIRSAPDGITPLALRAMGSYPSMELGAVLSDLTRQGKVYSEGKGLTATYRSV